MSMNHPPDMDRLLERFTPNDAQVSEVLVEGYRAGLYRLAFAMLGDADEAEDALQQTFINAIRHLNRYQKGTNFRAWLYTIAVNTCRGALRKRSTRLALTGLLGRIQQHASDPAGAEQVVAQGETTRQLWTAVAGLAEKHRLVILLRFQQEMSIAEIARVLSIPKKTVYSRLYDALRVLRRALPGISDCAAEAANSMEAVL
jgi:RNA polymerase sigma-70 factor (ECF subfamily)